MATNSNLHISTSKADMQKFANFQIVISEGKVKSRMNLLVENAADLRFNVACVEANKASFFEKIVYHFTHVKMTVDGKVIYINKNSAAKRLGLTIEQVKIIAMNNDLETLRTMATKHKEIHDFFDKYDPNTRDRTNICPRAYSIFMQSQNCLYPTNGEQLDNLRDCKTRLIAFSQFEFHRLRKDTNFKLFQINGCLFAIAKFNKPEGTPPPGTDFPINGDFALVHLNLNWEKQTPSFELRKRGLIGGRFYIDETQKITRINPSFFRPQSDHPYYDSAVVYLENELT